jgi:hypothetical protein
MSKKISKNTEQQILIELKKGTTYSEIVEKFQVSKGLITKIKNRSDAKLEVKKASKKTISHRRKIQEKAIQRNIINNSELIVNGYVNSLEALQYSVKNLVEINEESKEKSEKIVEELEKLNQTIDEKLKANNIDDVKEKNDLIKDIYKVIGAAGNFYARETVRIKAITELRGQVELSLKQETIVKAIENFKELTVTFFNAMNVLSDNEYIKFRNRVIELKQDAKSWFDEFETERE